MLNSTEQDISTSHRNINTEKKNKMVFLLALELSDLAFILFVIYVSIRSCCLVCSLQPCSHLLGKSDLFALLCVMFSCVFLLSHVVSWVRCGT